MKTPNKRFLFNSLEKDITLAVMDLMEQGLDEYTAHIKVAEFITEGLNRVVDDGYIWSITCTKEDVTNKDLEEYHKKALDSLNTSVKARHSVDKNYG